MSKRAGHWQRGLSLVELMVAMVIGLLIIAAVSSVYLSAKRSYQARDGLSLLQENGRIALKRLRSGISKAGYPGYENMRPLLADTRHLDQFAGLQGSNLEACANNTGNGTDRITIQFMPRGEVYTPEDCLGNESKSTARVVNSYYIENDTLKCRGSGNKAGQPIAENILDLQVLYGIDSDDDGVTDQYKGLPQGAADWNHVVAVRIGLLVSSGVDVFDRERPEQHLRILDQEVTVPASRMSYRVFTETIPLRNKLPICNDCG